MNFYSMPFTATLRRYFFLFPFFTLSFICLNSYLSYGEIPAKPLTLKQVYEYALLKNESIPIQDERILQAEEKDTQAKGAILPKANLMANYLYQASPGDAAASSAKSTQSNIRLNVTQPIFHGFREFALYRSVQADLESQKATREQSKLSLFSQVGQAYYNVLFAEQDLKNLQVLLDLTQKRVVDLQERARVGRSRSSEVLTAQSQVSILKNQLENAQLVIDQARESFAFVTGLSKNSPLVPLEDSFSFHVEDLNSYLSSIEKRPDIAALNQQVISSEEQQTAAKGAHYPSVDFSGNYYFQRAGSLEGTNWDIGFTFSLPLYQGGVLSSQVSEAASRVKEKSLLFYQGKRNAEKEIRAAYDTVTSNLAQFKTLSEAFKIAQKTYEEQNRDYRLGLSTNLDVLQSLNTLEETKRTLDRTRNQIFASWVTLQAATGRLP